MKMHLMCADNKQNVIKDWRRRRGGASRSLARSPASRHHQSVPLLCNFKGDLSDAPRAPKTLSVA